MIPKGRPEGEYRSAKHEGGSLIPKGRPEGEYRSAKRQGGRVNGFGAIQRAAPRHPSPGFRNG
jgi:hypothetical protein